MKNILVVNVNWLGDAVFSTPVFRALQENYPQARLTCLCVPRVKEVLEHCPFIDNMMVYDEKGKDRFLGRKLNLIQKLRNEKFDAGFLLHRSMTRALMVYLAGIPLRIGYSKSKGLLTHPIAMNAEDIHRSDYYLKIVEDYGLKVLDRSCELKVKPDDLTLLTDKLKNAGMSSNGNYIVLNTGANWDLKRWPNELFALLAKRVSQEYGLTIIFPGAPKDKENCQKIIQEAGIKAINLAGQTSLGESLALYQKALVVVSGDSGPLHLANSVGSPAIGIFGPTRPEITGPRGKAKAAILFKDVSCNKAPCYHLTCSNNVCMQSVTVDDVCQAIKKFIT
ncbi:MAG: lipopolysaccharide heptosyltransferase II [Candidatus Omnitrophica bacterium]|nr:lipopolysaccharide heptosyltransferase II [Candidatus Omnitrophota bacterium]